MTVYIVAPESLVLPEIAGKIVRIRVAPAMTENPYLRVIWELLVLPHLIKQLGIDLLFCPGGSVGRRIPETCKIATTFQNMMPFDLKQRRKYPFGPMRLRNWLLEKILLSGMLRSDLVIFISQFAKSVIEVRSKRKRLHSVVIPHGINSEFRRGSMGLAKPTWLPSDEYFLYVSTLDVYKAQIEVIEAYAMLRKKRPTAPKLVLIGPEYLPYGNKVRESIARLGLVEDVLTLGNVPHSDLPAAYQNAKVNIFASETENCPFILLEALGSGRPMLVSNCPPMPEFAGDSVIYFNPGVPSELAERLLSLLDDPALMETMASGALEQSNRFNWDATGSATWNALEAVVDGASVTG